MKAFLSYSSDDHSLVHTISGVLIEAGIEPVVASQELAPGRPLSEKIKRLIRESDCVVAVLTQSVLDSDWVQQELACADAHSQRVVPLTTQHEESLPAMFEGVEYYPLELDDLEPHLWRVAVHLREWALENGLEVRDTSDLELDDFELLHLPRALVCPVCGNVENHAWLCLYCGDWVCVECGGTVPPSSVATDQDDDMIEAHAEPSHGSTE